MKKTRGEALAIFNELGIEVKEIEEGVFEVLNKKERVNLDTLKQKFMQMALIMSFDIKYKDCGNYDSSYTYIYYVILDSNDDTAIDRCYDTVVAYDNTAVISYATTKENYRENIDTLYIKDEM